MINSRLRTALREIIAAENIVYDFPLRNYTSFRIGGPADALITVNEREQLNRLLCILSNENVSYFVIGKGTNLLINDNGYGGVVLKLGDGFKRASFENNYITAGAGLLMSKMVSAAARNNLGGIEHLAVIPGTVGGGITQNAGSSSQEIKTHLVSVEVMDVNHGVMTIMKDDLKMSYRTSVFKNEAKGNIILSSRLTLEPREFITIKNDIKEKLISRKQRLPLKYHNAGSIFKKPANGIPPRKLIEEAGCKGLCAGGAEVSQKHANFIVNKGNARFDDILKLIDLVRQRVMTTSGISLELEIEVVY